MVENDIEVHFMKHLVKISTTMIDKDSSYATQMKVIEEQFQKYGLTNEQFASITSEINGAATQYITQYANASSLELVKLEQNQPLLEAQIELAKKDLELKEKDLELKDKDIALKEKELLLKDKELELKDKELTIMDKEIAIKEAELLIRQEELNKMYAEIKLIDAKVLTETKNLDLIDQEILVKKQQVLLAQQDVLVKKKDVELKTQEILLKAQQVKESQAKECLIRSQCVTEGKQQGMITAQTGLVNRQTAGYGDNMLVKAAEFQGGLASFAVNSGSDTAGSAITAFQTTINQMKTRS